MSFKNVKNKGKRLLSLILSLVITSCFIPLTSMAEGEASKEVVNYALGARYEYKERQPTLTVLSDENRTILTNGVIPTEETPGETVAFTGTLNPVEVTMFLDQTYNDINSIAIRGVKKNLNRAFSPEKTVIRFSEDGINYFPMKDFDIVETQVFETCYDFTFKFRYPIKANRVIITMVSPEYVLSIGEIEVLSGDDYVEESSVAYGKMWSFSNKGKMTLEGVWNKTSILSGWSKYYNSAKELYIGDDIETVKSRDAYERYEPFEGNKSIEFVKIGEKLSEYSFRMCSSLKEVVINSTADIAPGTFEMCKALEKVTLPEGLLVVGSSAFSGCASLKEIKLPETVKEIHSASFSGCTSLEKINIPQGIEYIGGTSLYNTALYEDEANWYDNCFYIGNILMRVDEYCSASEITVKNGTVRIAESAFWECQSVEKITIPESVKYIGDSAFSCCYELKEVNLPSRLAEITPYMFALCEALESIELPSGIQKIGDFAFSSCSSLGSIEIPEAVTYIGEYAFEMCGSLTEIELPKGVKEISAGAFNMCWSLEKVVISAKIKTIPYSAFEDCSSLKEINVPNSVISISDSAFKNCSRLEKVTLSSNLKTIGKQAFMGCGMLESVAIPVGVIIGDDSSILGTGSVIRYGNVNRITVIVKGDVDGTGVIDSTDYMRIKKKFLGEITLDGIYLDAADVNPDGVIDITDYMKIKKHFLGSFEN